MMSNSNQPGRQIGGVQEELARLHRRIADQAREMQVRPDTDIDAVTDELVRGALEDVAGAQYAGITVVEGRTRVRTAAASHHYPEVLDAIQQRYLEGPCLAAQWEQHSVRVPDLTTETRWPDYCRNAVQATPIRSILSFQLFAGPQQTGALNVYAEHADAFSPEAHEVGIVYAAHAALAWRSVRRELEFASALASRDVIGQAKGMIMERYRVDAVRAFEMLKRLSQGSNIPLAKIAERLVATAVDSDE